MLTVYGKGNDKQCNALAIYLKRKGIRFNYIDIKKDVTGIEAAKRLGIVEVPVITFNWRIIYGFDIAKLNELIKEERLENYTI